MNIGHTHELKCQPPYFEHVASGHKKFEVRVNDRGYREGDTLWLREWSESTDYTGREVSATVGYVLHGPQFGVSDGYSVLSLSRVEWKRGHICECESFKAAKGPYPSGICPECQRWFPGINRARAIELGHIPAEAPK